MGVPTQGAGPTTSWSGDGSGYDAGPYDLPNDGAVWSFATVMVLLARIINSLQGLYTGTSLQVAAYSGAIWTIAAGPLSTFLRALADKAAKVDNANTFSSAQTFSGGATVSTALLVGGGATFGAKIQRSAGAYDTRVSTDIATNATAATISASYSAWVADAWAGAGGNLAVTLNNYAGGDNAEITFKFAPNNILDTCEITKQGSGSPFLTITGPGTIVFRYSTTNSRWAAFQWSGSVAGQFY